MTDARYIDLKFNGRKDLDLLTIQTSNNTKFEHANGLTRISISLTKKDIKDLYLKLNIHLGLVE